MKNDKTSCIFDHDGFMYVCNFDLMVVWIITEEDETDPVTALEITKLDGGAWAYRQEGSDGPFLPDHDPVLSAKITKHYEQYINRIIVGQNGRATYTAKAMPTNRVRPPRVSHQG